MSRNRLIFLLLICLLAALVPQSDFDQDGKLDSLVTEGFLLMPAPVSVTGLFFLLTSLPAVGIVVAQAVSKRLVPPPIYNG